MGARTFVGAALGHRHEGVRRGHDARRDRNLLAGEPVGIARAVEVLVMAAYDLRRPGQSGHNADERLAGDGVVADPVTRLLVERTAVGEDVGGHRDLAAVVQPAAEARKLDVRGRQVELERDGRGQGCDLAACIGPTPPRTDAAAASACTTPSRPSVASTGTSSGAPCAICAWLRPPRFAA